MRFRLAPSKVFRLHKRKTNHSCAISLTDVLHAIHCNPNTQHGHRFPQHNIFGTAKFYFMELLCLLQARLQPLQVQT